MTDATTFDARVYQTEVYKGRQVTTYWVRWRVSGRLWKEPFRTVAQADSFRSSLLTAARKGEAFSVASGRPVTWEREKRATGWYEFACAYADLKWKQASAKYRKDIARALTAATPARLIEARGRPDDASIRGARAGWGFNTKQRSGPPGDIAEVGAWVARESGPVSARADAMTARRVLVQATGLVDGRMRPRARLAEIAPSWPMPRTTQSNWASLTRTRFGRSSGPRPRYPARSTGEAL